MYDCVEIRGSLNGGICTRRRSGFGGNSASAGVADIRSGSCRSNIVIETIPIRNADVFSIGTPIVVRTTGQKLEISGIVWSGPGNIL